MGILDAVIAAGQYPRPDAPQAEKKRYAERLSHALAPVLAASLRALGLPDVKPHHGQPGEKAFQGGLGPKRVDVSYSDEQHGLLLAVSIKSITAPPFGKNLKNRFGDLCTEAITLHMRFPYSVVCCLFAFPHEADLDMTAGRPVSTFQRAMKLMSTLSGRDQYTGPGEKFERVTMMLFKPVTEGLETPWVRLFDAETGSEISEDQYLRSLISVFNDRNPHMQVDLEEPLA